MTLGPFHAFQKSKIPYLIRKLRVLIIKLVVSERNEDFSMTLGRNEGKKRIN